MIAPSKRAIAAGRSFSLRSLLKPIPDHINELTFRELWKTEWSTEFEELQRHRLVMGAIRYGRLNSSDKKQWDRPKDIKKRITLYQETSNLEHLVDAANLCMLEFEEGRYPNRHFSPQDDQIHTSEKNKEIESGDRIRLVSKKYVPMILDGFGAIVVNVYLRRIAVRVPGHGNRIYRIGIDECEPYRDSSSNR